MPYTLLYAGEEKDIFSEARILFVELLCGIMVYLFDNKTWTLRQYNPTSTRLFLSCPYIFFCFFCLVFADFVDAACGAVVPRAISRFRACFFSIFRIYFRVPLVRNLTRFLLNIFGLSK
eukprot:m.80634 g.80634  ORF g.80634 m.80634 type:complete len:119 (+) comp16300_c0_seq2:105-461(+)